MRLSEGQVMDYTKDAQPYMDERFTNQVQAVAQEAAPRTVESTVVATKPPLATMVTMPALWTPAVPGKDDRIKKLVEKVRARQEAIKAVDEMSPAAKSVLKTLDWVIQSAESL